MQHWLLLVLSQVFRIPWVTDRGPVRVLDVEGPIMYDLANSVGCFPIWSEDDGTLYMGVLKHSPEYKASDGEGSPLAQRGG